MGRAWNGLDRHSESVVKQCLQQKGPGWPNKLARYTLKMLVKDAKLLGNISKGNTKMPGTTFAIDAFACITGSKLAKIPGTSCSKCYARRLQTIRPSVDQGWKANLAKLKQALLNGEVAQWVQAMAMQILRYNTDGKHRWFDAGDVQNHAMLHAICQVCLATPSIKHWLPSQERAIVNKYFATHAKPANLVVRISASKIDGPLPRATHTSNVFSTAAHVHGFECRARTRGNKCGPCDACWRTEVRNISYPLH